jgi:hypothetical protein
MRFILVLLLALGSLVPGYGQQLPDFTTIPLKEESDFNKTANDAALKAATFILSTASVRENAERSRAIGYMMQWMEGTPAYAFNIDAALAKVTGEDRGLFVVVLAGMVEFMLQNEAKKDDMELVRLNAVRKLLGYVQNPSYGITPDGELKNAIAAEKKSELKTYLAKLAEE